MLQLFQTRDGPFFFIVTLVYTCCAFSAVSSKNINHIYCFGHTSSQSVLQWNSFSPLKYIVYKCYSCFRPGIGHFFHRHTCLHLSRFSFAVSSENIYPIYCFGHSSSQSVSQWNSFSPLKYIVYKCYSCFRPGMGHYFFIVTLVALFLAVSSKNIYPIYCFGHSSSQSVLQWNSFSPLKYIVYKCYSCFRPGMGLFFSSSHLSTLVALFCCIIKKYLSHILFWSQFVSVCFAMKFFFSFKIHCLQMLQLFQTRDGPFFFHRHTCLHLSRFFCCIIKKYLSHTLFWSQFVSVCFAMKFFFSFKIHCLQMLQLFQTRDGPFFFRRHTYLHLSRFFCCIIKKYLSHILFWSQFVSVCFAMKFIFSFKIHCLQMLQLFQTRNGPFFFIVTLVALFLLYHQKIFIPYIVLVTVRLSLFRNEILFLL